MIRKLKRMWRKLFTEKDYLRALAIEEALRQLTERNDWYRLYIGRI